MFNCIKGGNRASNSRRRFTEFEPDDTRSNTRSEPILFSTEPEHGGKMCTNYVCVEDSRKVQYYVKKCCNNKLS